MSDAVRYIAAALGGPKAANRLADAFKAAAASLAEYPHSRYSHCVHALIRPFAQEYRRVVVGIPDALPR
ncbi:hypothetical protein [Bifidobacterium sp.]|jgi:plasmid stabilization system protein ParE|uniref:hypothetical protein n=1 Tax=Bifidobacterium sp. TaxID=41200 RepID=UPI00341353EC|nr:hypothetical protein [Bifidobacterium sp.]MCI1225245.1 hypothetical protein [Bifidobacterium sp.]